MIKYGRWVVIKESQTKYNLAIVNLDSHQKLDAIPVGRGPGEMTLGDNLYLEGTGVTLTDAYKLTTVSLDMSEMKEDRIPKLDTLGTFKSVKNAFSLLRKLKEVTRIEYNRPKLNENGGKTTLEANRAFSGIASDKEHVFLLYSGRGRNDIIPDYEGNHIIVYDWNGNYVARYYLSRNVMDIFIDGDELYCLSTYPSCKIFVYRLPKIS